MPVRVRPSARRRPRIHRESIRERTWRSRVAPHTKRWLRGHNGRLRLRRMTAPRGARAWAPSTGGPTPEGWHPAPGRIAEPEPQVARWRAPPHRRHTLPGTTQRRPRDTDRARPVSDSEEGARRAGRRGRPPRRSARGRAGSQCPPGRASPALPARAGPCGEGLARGRARVRCRARKPRTPNRAGLVSAHVRAGPRIREPSRPALSGA
jgi:hypothetical protein